ncbi:MAG: hypothetical protein GX162_04310 [Firmicutes bacterium]|nr:hypothetical protein [Bacillota bacterium]
MLGIAPLRGWGNSSRFVQVENLFEELDCRIRRRLRCLIRRQWKRPYTRARNLIARRLTARAWQSATNGRGPRWNAGASHLSEAVKESFFCALGLVSLLDQHRGFRKRYMNRRATERFRLLPPTRSHRL